MYQERNVGVCILLTIITCGLYGLYWFICLTDDVNRECDEKLSSGGIALLLNIITCGLYGIYWSYKMGKNIQNSCSKHDISISDNSVLYLVLCLIGFGIINYALIQSDLNRLANETK